jgi:aminopeptidase N
VALLALGLAGTAGAQAQSPSAEAPSAGPPVAGSDRGPDPYWPLDGNGGTDARHYDIRVRYDFGSGRLTGRTAVTMVATEDLRSLSLDLLLPVTDVTVDGRAARFGKPSKHELRVVPAHAIAKGQRFKVVVRYAGRPAAYGYAGERNWLADRAEVVAMNQPHMAPWWFPSNDHPSDKATYDVRVNVPRGKQVVGNGVRVGRKVSGARATTHWRETAPMATYLAFFAAGDFAIQKGRSASGIPYYNAVSKRLPRDQQPRITRVLRRSAAITDWLQSRLGSYPFASTGGLVTSLDVGFALENQTRPTYGSWIYPSVVVHELAHQWFGDSVAVRRWRDIWLNEGFATFMEVQYAAAHGGPSVEQFLDDGWDAACGTPSSSYWRLNIADPGPAHVFDDPVYDRGALTLAALQHRIGAGAMTTLLRRWVSEHRGGNGTIEQFEALASSVAGADLSGFFDAWLRSGSAPEATAANGLDHACP